MVAHDQPNLRGRIPHHITLGAALLVERVRVSRIPRKMHCLCGFDGAHRGSTPEGQAPLAHPGDMLVAQLGDGFGNSVEVIDAGANVHRSAQCRAYCVDAELIRVMNTKSSGIVMRRTTWSGARRSISAGGMPVARSLACRSTG